MSGLYFLAAFFIAAFGAVLIGFALNGKRRRRRLARLLRPKKTSLTELKGDDDARGVRLYGYAAPAASGALSTAFTGEAAVYEKLFLEQWLHTWVPTLAERRGEHFVLTETPEGGARVRVPLDDADLMLKTLTTKYATLMFDEEDVAEYTEKVPEPFRARVIEHVKAAPGWYRVRIERIAVGTPLFVLGKPRRISDAEGEAFEVGAMAETALLITDHDEQELFRPPPLVVLMFAALIGVVMLTAGMVLLVWTG